MPAALAALQASVAHLNNVVSSLTPDQYEASAYPTEWTIADVASHLGSGAVIIERRIEDSLTGLETPEDFAPSVWDIWNAKAPADQVADGLVTDRALLDRLESMAEDERARFEVAVDPSAGVSAEATAVSIDGLGMLDLHRQAQQAALQRHRRQREPELRDGHDHVRRRDDRQARIDADPGNGDGGPHDVHARRLVRDIAQVERDRGGRRPDLDR